MNYILVLIATVLLAFEFALSKKYQACEGADFVSGLKFNALSGVAVSVIFFALSGFKIEFSAFSAIIAVALSLVSTAYSIIGFKILKFGSMSIYSIFLMSGGMLLPYIFGVLFLNEQLTFLRVLGILVILFAIIISNLSKTKLKLNATFFLLCIVVFVLNGFVSIFSKCHQIAVQFNPVPSANFVIYSGLIKSVLCSILLLFYKSDKKKFSFSSKNTLLIILGAAFISGVSYVLQLVGAKELPATVLYPLVTGGGIIFSSLSGIVFFKEKLSRNQIISIVLCFIGTLLFL